MISISHCKLSNTWGALCAGFTPSITESICENAYRAIDNEDRLRSRGFGVVIPGVGNHSLAGYSENSLQYNIFRNISNEVYKSYGGFFNTSIPLLETTFYHNTFYSIGTVIKIDWYYLERTRVINLTALYNYPVFISNLIFNCSEIYSGRTIKLYTSYNILNGVYNPDRFITEENTIINGNPLFYNPDDNLRLVLAGLDYLSTGFTPAFDSIGIFSAHDENNIGAYHLLLDELIFELLSDPDIYLESPPGTSIELHSLNAETLDGFSTHHSFSNGQANIIKLDYPDTYGHERNRILHAFRQIRKSKTPLWIMPFSKPIPPDESDWGITIRESFWYWWEGSVNNYGFHNNTIYPMQLTNIAITTTNKPYSSFESVKILEANIDPINWGYFSGLGGVPSNIIWDWLIGWQIIIQSLNDYLLVGVIVEIENYIDKPNRIKVLINEDIQLSPIGTTAYCGIGKAFWSGAVKFFNYEKETNNFVFGIRKSLPEVPYHTWDDFVLTLANDYEIKQFIRGDYVRPGTPTVAWQGISNLTSETRQASFILKSLGQNNGDYELYTATPIHPLNPYNWQSLDDVMIADLIDEIAFYFDRIQGGIDSFIFYPSQDNVTAQNQGYNSRDIWFEKGAEWYPHYYQAYSKPESLGGMAIQLLQTKPHRGLLPFKYYTNTESIIDEV